MLETPARYVSSEESSLVSLAQEMRYPDVSSLYAAVGEGHAAAGSVVTRLVQTLGGEEGAEEDLAEAATPSRARRTRLGGPGVIARGVEDVWVKLAKCCTPVPPATTRKGASRSRSASARSEVSA